MLIFFVSTMWHAKCVSNLIGGLAGNVVVVTTDKTLVKDHIFTQKANVLEVSGTIKSPIKYCKDLMLVKNQLSKLGEFKLITFVDKPPIVQLIFSMEECREYIMIEEGVGLYYDGKEVRKIKKTLIYWFEDILYYIFFNLNLKRGYKEQGRFLIGDRLFCRYTSILDSSVQKNFKSITVFDKYFSNNRSNLRTKDIIYFIGCDYYALNVVQLELQAIDAAKCYSTKIGASLVYLVHPRIKSLSESINKRDLKVKTFKDVDLSSGKKMFFTCCSGAVVDLVYSGHEIYFPDVAYSEKSPYSKFFRTWVNLDQLTTKRIGSVTKIELRPDAQGVGLAEAFSRHFDC